MWKTSNKESQFIIEQTFHFIKAKDNLSKTTKVGKELKKNSYVMKQVKKERNKKRRREQLTGVKQNKFD